jgi:hypothetical protein
LTCSRAPTPNRWSREEISFYTLTKTEYFRVDSVDSSQGNYHMRVQYQDLLLSMLAPQLKIDISSSIGKKSLALHGWWILFERENVFHLSMSPSGELKSLEGMEDSFFRPL